MTVPWFSPFFLGWMILKLTFQLPASGRPVSPSAAAGMPSLVIAIVKKDPLLTNAIPDAISAATTRAEEGSRMSHGMVSYPYHIDIYL